MRAGVGGEGRKEGKRRNTPCKSVGKVGESCPGRRRRAGEKKLEGVGVVADIIVATLELGAGSYKICFAVSASLSKLNWEALAWRQKRACAGLGSADEGGWRLG